MVQGSRRRGRIFIYIALILILGLVLVWVLMRGQTNLPFGGSKTQTQPTAIAQEEMTDIVITTQPVARGTVFTEGVLTMIKYPKKEVIAGTFYTNPADVIGKRAKYDLSPRVPLTTSMVVDTLEGSFAAFQIPQGMVAISIPIDKLTSVSYAPQPGDHVNVIAAMMFSDLDTNFQTNLPNYTGAVVAPGNTVEQANLLTTKISSGEGPAIQGRAELDPTLNLPIYVIPSERQRPRMVSQTLLQDAVVLQVGLFPVNQKTGAAALQATPTPAPVEGQPTPAPASPELPNLITLIVPPQDAVTLNYLMNTGAQLTMVLRGAGDEQRVQTEAVTLQYLMDQYNVPVPAKLPYGLEPRVDMLRVPSANPTPTPAPK